MWICNCSFRERKGGYETIPILKRYWINWKIYQNDNGNKKGDMSWFKEGIIQKGFLYSWFDSDKYAEAADNMVDLFIEIINKNT